MPISQIRQVVAPEAKPTTEKIQSRVESDRRFQSEKAPEKIAERPGTETGEPPAPAVMPHPIPVYAPTRLVSDEVKIVENILEEDLGVVYFALDRLKQEEFKTKGEKTANKIVNILAKPKVKIKKIIFLIRDWLMIVPGINKFFLEQSVKIKTDKILQEFKTKR